MNYLDSQSEKFEMTIKNLQECFPGSVNLASKKSSWCVHFWTNVYGLMFK